MNSDARVLVAEELRVGDVMEDDELLNIGLWEDGAVRQLCRLVSTQMQTQIFVQLSMWVRII